MPSYPPPRWLDYQPFGSPVASSPLLPVKLPIPASHSRYIPKMSWFTDADLINFCFDIRRPLVGVIDLTYTTYYNPRLFTDRGIKHAKIFVPGHAVPDSPTVDKFLQTVNEIASESSDGVVAVHCTHGVNRTGYFVCRYLIDVLGWDPSEALEEFAHARGYSVERSNYIEDLQARR